MKKIGFILSLCLLMLSGCQQSISKIEVTKQDDTIIVVEKDKYQEFETLIENLSFTHSSEKVSDPDYYGLYITQGNTIYSYYIYEDGIIEYDQNNDKNAPRSTENKEVAQKLIDLIDSIK